MKPNKNKFIIYALSTVLILIVILSLGAAIALHSRTMVEWWWPVAICSLLAIPLTILLAGPMRTLTSPIIDYLEYPAAFVVGFSLLICAFYTINYQCTNPSSRSEYPAPIVAKYTAERTSSTRSGRHSYKSTTYHVYFLEIELKDGRTKKIEVPHSRYLKTKKGQRIPITEEKGLFGLTVIKNLN